MKKLIIGFHLFVIFVIVTSIDAEEVRHNRQSGKKVSLKAIPIPDFEMKNIYPESLDFHDDKRLYCSGEWQGGVTGYYASGLVWGDEYYAVYQDPAEVGCPNAYPFNVIEVAWAILAQYSVSFNIQPLVLEYLGPDSIGQILCAGPLYTINLPSYGPYFLDLPLASNCCVPGPYFAGLYIETSLGPGVIEVYTDLTGPVPPQSDRTYIDWGTGWLDLVDDLGLAYNIELWSQGFSADENTCGCCQLVGDVNHDGGTDISDLTYYVAYMFSGGPAAPCFEEGDIDGSGSQDISDLTYYVNFMFNGGPAPPGC